MPALYDAQYHASSLQRFVDSVTNWKNEGGIPPSRRSPQEKTVHHRGTLAFDAQEFARGEQRELEGIAYLGSPHTKLIPAE